jgi:xylulose-5-phosphate/fructose-6-phosphate phosphoketolase
MVDGVRTEGSFRSHQVPLAGVRENPAHLKMLEAWMRGYRPQELFDERGRLVPALVALAPTGARRLGANPHANGGRVLVDLDLPAFTDYALTVRQPGTEHHESTRALGKMMRDIFKRNAARRNFRLFCPDETNSNRLGDVFEAEKRCFVGPTLPDDDHLSPDGRVMEVLSEHNCHGWLEGYTLTGRHGLFATYEAFAMVSASMTVQHAKWLDEGIKLPWRAPIASLNILLTSTCWRNDHNGFSHQGPGLIDVVLSKKGTVSRIYMPPDANCLLAVADHCFRSRNYVNLIVIDKQPQLQWLDMASAIEHCARGASVWTWAGHDGGSEPDVVLAAAGDIPTMEVVAAAWLLRAYTPEMRVRVVNVVDLMALFTPRLHPHGLDEATFANLFTREAPVVFAFHGYQRAIHEIVHGRPNVERFHVRGYNEEGTTTTPFDMVVKNAMSRYHLCLEALRRVPRLSAHGARLAEHCRAMLERHESYIREHLEDMPEVRDWKWTTA